MRYFFYLSLILFLSGCLDSSENLITCSIAFDEDLLDNSLTSDSVYFRIEQSSNSELLDSWIGIVDEEATDSLGSTTYKNLTIKNRRPSNSLSDLNGLGIEISNPSDSTSAMLSFDFLETSTLERQCRYNKTLREEHFFSVWDDNKEGSRIDVVIKENGNRVLYSTDFEHQDDEDIQVRLLAVEFLDEARVFALLKGTFKAKVKNTENEEATPVEIIGEFQTVNQVSYGTNEF